MTDPTTARTAQGLAFGGVLHGGLWFGVQPGLLFLQPKAAFGHQLLMQRVRTDGVHVQGELQACAARVCACCGAYPSLPRGFFPSAHVPQCDTIHEEGAWGREGSDTTTCPSMLEDAEQESCAGLEGRKAEPRGLRTKY